MNDFDLTIERRQDAVVIALAGELDITTGVRLDDELQRLEADGPPLIVLDLRQLDFMDSTGLRILIGADARARDDGRRLALIKGTPMVQRLLRVTRLDERLEIVEAAAYAG